MAEIDEVKPTHPILPARRPDKDKPRRDEPPKRRQPPRDDDDDDAPRIDEYV